MIGVNHVLAGTLIAVIAPSEYVAYIPLFAIASHFILDTFVHYGKDETAPVGSKKFFNILKLDAVLCMAAFALAWYLYPDKLLWLAIGAFFAAAPDILWLFRDKAKSKISRLYFTFAEKIQWAEYSWAWSLELLWSMILITLLIGLS